MPTIDLGYVIGPQGPQGATGATGATGAAGAAGPNQVTGSTSTTLNGVLQGNGSRVSALSSDSAPTANSNNLVRSGVLYNSLAKKSTPNILDNWYFVGGGSQQGGQQFPLNHRGQTSYTGAAQSLDRWYNNGSGTTLTISSDRIDIAGGESSGYLAQRVAWGPLKGKPVTYSILYNDAGTLKLASGTGTVPTSAPASGTMTITNMNSQVTNGTGCGVYLNSSGQLTVQIGAIAGYTVKYLAVKLEVGTDQTLAWMNGSTYVISEAPNYTEQLERCFTSFADSNDGNSGFYPAGGKISAAGNPYIRFLVDSSMYQFSVAPNGNLVIQKYTSGSWTTIAEYAHI